MCKWNIRMGMRPECPGPGCIIHLTDLLCSHILPLSPYNVNERKLLNMKGFFNRIHGVICQDNKITFSNNIWHQFFRVEWLFTIYEHPSPCRRWQRNRTGDHFLHHKFIKRTFESRANSTEQLLNAGREHQAPRKAAHCLQKEVGQNIKDKKRDKRGRDGDPSRERSLKKERSFWTPGNTLSGGSVASRGISEGKITRRKNK